MKVMAMSKGVLRVLVSIVAIPIILTASYFGRYYFLFFVLLIALIAFYEFSLLVQNKKAYMNLFIGLLSVFCLIVNSYLKLIDNYTILLIIIAVLCFVELFRNQASPLLNLGTTLLGILYIGLFSAALVSIREFYVEPYDSYLNGGILIISIFAAIWICDSAAYYIGTAIGKHKLFPRISPKKSWEGAVSGFIFAVLTMIAARFLLLDFLSWTSTIGIGIIIGFFGQIGDLIESLFKRDSGVKDSSGIIPGHGGIFDRFDSLFFSAPLIFLLLNLIEK
jgi:phosphatidate cytidylyltransferase